MKHSIAPQLASLAVPIATLVSDPSNARAHDERNINSILQSYREHGQRKPIVVQRRSDAGQEFVIRAGNGSVEAAKKLGWTHVAALIVDEPDVDAVKYALRDNRTADLAEWDLPNLGASLRSLRDQGVVLEEVGWEPYEAEPLMIAEWAPPERTDEQFSVPERRQSLMFTGEEWKRLVDHLAEKKPTAAMILKAIGAAS